jgi:hypothetical protein
MALKEDSNDFGAIYSHICTVDELIEHFEKCVNEKRFFFSKRKTAGKIRPKIIGFSTDGMSRIIFDKLLKELEFKGYKIKPLWAEDGWGWCYAIQLLND